jgi:hypothetical protein
MAVDFFGSLRTTTSPLLPSNVMTVIVEQIPFHLVNAGQEGLWQLVFGSDTTSKELYVVPRTPDSPEEWKRLWLERVDGRDGCWLD